MFLWACSAGLAAAGTQSIPLWPNGAPDSEGKSAPETVRVNQNGEHIVSSIHVPSIARYLPASERSTGAAVIVMPGGGHSELWMDHEGYNIARWLSDRGVAAFVLKYWLAREKGSTYMIEGEELSDAKRAILLSNAPVCQPSFTSTPALGMDLV